MKNIYRRIIIFTIIGLFIGTIVIQNSISMEENSVDDIDWWSKFHHDSLNSGYSTSKAPNTNNLKWDSLIGGIGSQIYSSPAVYKGMLFVGSSNYKIYCLDADTGENIWSYLTGGSIWSSPCIYDEKIFVGSWDKNLYCLDANSGEKIWSYLTGGYVSSSPLVENGKVYFGSRDDNIFCLNAENGEEIWNYKTGGNVDSSPALANGMLYICSSDKNIYCLDADTGEKIWSCKPRLAYFSSSPTINNDKIYVASSGWEENDVYGIYCLDSNTGYEIWNYSMNNPIYSSPSIAYNKIFFGSSDYNFYCLNAENGEEIWNYKTGNKIMESSPAIADGKVYFGSWDDKIYCLNAENGEKIWIYSTGDNILSSPAIAEGRVYIGSSDGYAYCFDANNPPMNPTCIYDTENDELLVSATDPNDDQVKYGVSWNNDGIINQWTSFVSSGTELTINCDGKKGIIGVIAEDEQGAKSDWVSVKLKSKPYLFSFFNILFQRFPLSEKILNQII